MSQGIVYEYEDGGTYCGEWERDSAQGYGCGTGPKGKGKYEGLWEKGGQVSGVYTWPCGMKYMGSWKNNRRDGLGKEVGGDGVEYTGEFIRGARGPYGVSRLPTGVYRGSWRNGKQDGEGEEVYLDGGCYRGQYKNGVRSGFGIRTSAAYELRDKTQDLTKGPSNLPAALFKRSAALTATPGSSMSLSESTGEQDKARHMQVYEGEWRDDKRHGYGVIKCLGSYTYYGQWVANARTGYGVLMGANGVKEEGQWQNGELLVALKRKKLHLKSHQLETKVQTAHTQAIQAADTARNKAMLAESRSSTATGKSKMAQGVISTAEKNARLAREKAELYKNGIKISEGIKSPVENISLGFPSTETLSPSPSPSRPDSRTSNSSKLLEVESIPHVPSFENLNYYSSSHSLDHDGDDCSSSEAESTADAAERRRKFSDHHNSNKSSLEDKRKDSNQSRPEVLSGLKQRENRRYSEAPGGERQRPRRRPYTSFDSRMEGAKEWITMKTRDKTTGEINYNSDEDLGGEEAPREVLHLNKPPLKKKGSEAINLLVDNLNQMANWNKMIAYLNFFLLIVLIVLILVVVMAMYYYQLTSYYHNHSSDDQGPSTSFVPLP